MRDDFEQLAASMVCCDLYAGPMTATIFIASGVGTKNISYAGPWGLYSLGNAIPGTVSPHPFMINNQIFYYTRYSKTRC